MGVLAAASSERGLKELCTAASELRDREKGKTVSFSPKVFIPLTRLCRDFCSYCTYRQSPQEADSLYLSPEEILDVARRGEKHGCREALFVLGERPEQRYPQARAWLRERGYDGTLHYLYEMCRLVLRETSLYPHSNPGTLSRHEMASLKTVNVSLGLMLESISSRLCEPDGPHWRAPSKRPTARLNTLRRAGELRIPFTTGLLIGIGETAEERAQALQAIRELHERHGHIQEVIIQNFLPKPHTPLASSSGPQREEMLQTAAEARLILGGRMNIQVPPNLSMDNGAASYLAYLKAGINDWGGISPVTIDYVNPEAPWPHIEQMSREMKTLGFRLRARFPVYPEYIVKKDGFLPDALGERLRKEADREGYVGSEPFQ